MDLDKWDKLNKKAALQKAMKEAIKITLILVLGSSILPAVDSISNFKYYLYLAIAIVAIIKFHKEYYGIKNRLDCSTIIRDIKKNDVNPAISLKKAILTEESLMEVSQKKIDFCKMLYPTPFFTYWLGVYLDKGDKSNTILDTNILGFDITTGILFISFLILIIYIFYIIKYFKNYAVSKHYITEYQKTLIVDSQIKTKNVLKLSKCHFLQFYLCFSEYFSIR